MFNMIAILNERGITYDEVYRACDVANLGYIDILEMVDVLQSYSAEFYQKDCVAIQNFFDIAKNGKCTEQVYLKQIQKAERLLQDQNQRMAGIKLDVVSTGAPRHDYSTMGS